MMLDRAAIARDYADGYAEDQAQGDGQPDHSGTGYAAMSTAPPDLPITPLLGQT